MFIVFVKICLGMDYPNNDVTSTFSDVTAYAISASGYSGIILFLIVTSQNICICYLQICVTMAVCIFRETYELRAIP